MSRKTIVTVIVSLGVAVCNINAEMLYKFTFSGEDKFANQGKQGGAAKVIKFAGKGIEFVNDAPVKGKTACNFILKKARRRAAKLELPDSENILRCAKKGDEITLMTWVKWRGCSRGSGIASTSTSNQKSGWGFRIQSNGKLLFMAFGSFGNRSSKQSIEKNKWTHVAFSWHVGGSLKMYINGVRTGLNQKYISKKALPLNNNNIRIGVQTPSFHFPLNGELFDLRLYDEVLTPDKIAEAAAEIKINPETEQNVKETNKE